MSQASLPARRAGSARRWLGRSVLALGSLLILGIALIATMPAQSVSRFVNLPPQVRELDGAVLNGRALLQGGYAISWRARPAGLLLGTTAAEVEMNGEDTQLTALAELGPGGAMVRDLSGRAGPGIFALMPGLRLRCDTRLSVAVPRLSTTPRRWTAEGTVRLSEGTCTAGSTPITLPASRLVLGSEGNAATALWQGEDGTDLGRLRLSPERRADIRIEPAGARLIPGLPTSAPTDLGVPF